LHRGPDEPTQAVLIDTANGRFYFFFTLFLMNAVAGRVWCGYLCPQAVWTDLFMWVERMLEGDRCDRINLDAAPWNARKIVIRRRSTSVPDSAHALPCRGPGGCPPPKAC
jgi:polyferredoxin